MIATSVKSATLASLVLLAAGGAAATDLEDLAWLAGSWCGVSDRGATQEEVWLEPKGGLMLGLHRDVSASGRSAFEFLRIEQDEAGIVYRASPGGGPTTDFRLVETGSERAVFANPEHDFPQRIVYWIEEGDALHARVEGSGDRAIEWRWERRSHCQADPGPQPEPAAAESAG